MQWTDNSGNRYVPAIHVCVIYVAACKKNGANVIHILKISMHKYRTIPFNEARNCNIVYPITAPMLLSTEAIAIKEHRGNLHNNR